MRVAKVSELIGTSDESWEDAARSAVRRASRTLAGISGFEVLRKGVKIARDGKTEFRVQLRLIFELAPDLEMHV